MGKNSLFFFTNLRLFCRFTSEVRQPSSSKPSSTSSSTVSCNRRREMNKRKMDNDEERRRFPLSMVVTDCVKRWFRDTLKEAREGDIAMQVLVGQMYLSGYGVSQNVQKGKAWIRRAANSRSSVWKVSNKRPGYNASDSDSDETKSDIK